MLKELLITALISIGLSANADNPSFIMRPKQKNNIETKENASRSYDMTINQIGGSIERTESDLKGHNLTTQNEIQYEKYSLTYIYDQLGNEDNQRLKIKGNIYSTQNTYTVYNNHVASGAILNKTITYYSRTIAILQYTYNNGSIVDPTDVNFDVAKIIDIPNASNFRNLTTINITTQEQVYFVKDINRQQSMSQFLNYQDYANLLESNQFINYVENNTNILSTKTNSIHNYSIGQTYDDEETLTNDLEEGTNWALYAIYYNQTEFTAKYEGSYTPDMNPAEAKIENNIQITSIYGDVYISNDTYVNNIEVIDIPSVVFTVLGAPFTFISQAFNLTLFPGTQYSVNISNLFLAIIAVLVFIWIIEKFVGK